MSDTGNAIFLTRQRPLQIGTALADKHRSDIAF